MAKVSITYQYPEGGAYRVEVQAASNYPDALSEARKTAVDALRQAMEANEPAEDGDE